MKVRVIELIALAGIACVPQAAFAQNTSWASIDSIFGRPGASQAGDVMRYSFPRGDLDVTVSGVKIKPAFALGSWVAFKRMGTEAMAMGDLVLGETEVGPVIDALQKGGVEQSALHNHLIGETPRVMYLHITAHGDPSKIARAVHEALSFTKTPLGPPSAPAAQPFALDTSAIAKALGYSGKVNGGVYQVSVPRTEKVTENGMEIPPAMGIATAINFQPTTDGNAAITGDFVMTANEVNPVIRALEKSHIQPTALHSHMLNESPRLFFMHFWANANAVDLARGLASALKEMRVQSPHA
jgi:hypothetical protein